MRLSHILKTTCAMMIAGSIVSCALPPQALESGTPQEKAQIWLAANTKIGAAVGVDTGNGTPSIYVSGVRAFGGTHPIEKQDIFHIGSVTKSMTAALTMHLADQGKLDINAPITTYFSAKERSNIDPYWNDVTLADLMSHRSGLDINMPDAESDALHGDPRPVSKQRTEKTMLWLAKPAPNQKGSFIYSNKGYMLIGHVLEKATGQSFESLMFAQLIKPLGLKSAGFGAPLGNAPIGHSKASLFGGITSHPTDTGEITDNPSIFNSAGRLHMSTGDLLKYGRAILDACLGKGSYLKTETCQSIFANSEIAQDGASYGFGWFISKTATGAPIYFHEGSNTLWHAAIALIPEQNIVVIVATNDGRALERQSKAFTNLILDVAK